MAGREVGPPGRPGAATTARLRAADGPVQVRVWRATVPESKPNPPTLLALHGWTDSADVFGPVVTALSGRWPVVAPDAPGHGETPLRAGPFVIADHLTPALAVLTALPRLLGGGHRSVVAYGHSMGALTATRLAAARPTLVRGLVLEEPARTTKRPTESSEGMRTWMRTLLAGDHASRLAWVRANHPTWPDAELEPWVRSKENVDLAHLDRPADWGEPLPALLSEVHCPVLIIRGEPARGGIVSRTGAQRCAAACPGGAQVLALEAGHSPHREAPAEFAAALAEVLANW
jgi:pimeloyl-ACP methyl ester carboxylesterase